VQRDAKFRRNPLKLKENVQGDILILRFEGRLDALTTPDVEKLVLSHIYQGQRKLLFDFTSVDYISSAGMRMLLSTTRQLKVHSGKVVLHSIHRNVMDVFTMSGFDHVLDIVLTEKEAFDKLK
jgi:anti-sigma B factor antagonist/stage II sporulation protein AA (anti-sigma F factor antagonist)